MVYFTRRNTASKLPSLRAIPSLHVKAAMESVGASAVAILLSSSSGVTTVTSPIVYPSFVMTRYMPTCPTVEMAECLALEMGLRHFLHRGHTQCVIDCATDNVYELVRGKPGHASITDAARELLTSYINRFETVILSYSCANPAVAETLDGLLSITHERSTAMVECARTLRQAAGRPLPADVSDRLLRQSMTSPFVSMETLRSLPSERIRHAIQGLTGCTRFHLSLDIVDQFETHLRNGTSPQTTGPLSSASSVPSAPSTSSSVPSAPSTSSSVPSVPSAPSASSVPSDSLAASSLAAVLEKEKNAKKATKRKEMSQEEDDDEEDQPLNVAFAAEKKPKRAYTSKLRALQTEMDAMRAQLAELRTRLSASSSSSASSASL